MASTTPTRANSVARATAGARATDDDLSDLFTLLEAWEFRRAGLLAQRLRCARRLAAALASVCTCEYLYSAMKFDGLARRLDVTAKELEACLALPAPLAPPAVGAWPFAQQPPGGDADGPRPADWFGEVFTSVVTCRMPDLSAGAGTPGSPTDLRQITLASETPSPPAPRGADEADGAAHGVADYRLSAAQRGALSDTVELLRLRRAMLPVYTELLSTPAHPSPGEAAPQGTKLADRASELRTSRAARLGAALLSGLREVVMVELGALEPLLRAFALLPDANMRDSLVSLSVAKIELAKLRSPARLAARARARALVADAGGAGGQGESPSPFSGLAARFGSWKSSSVPSTDEPRLLEFLRLLANTLGAKANLHVAAATLAWWLGEACLGCGTCQVLPRDAREARGAHVARRAARRRR